MFDHFWFEEDCSWVVAPIGREPDHKALARGEIYFVWGFLMAPRFIEKIVGRVVSFAPAVIRGYRRKVGRRQGKPIFRLVPDETGVVMGVALLGLSKSEIAALDRFEQAPGVMVKRRIRVMIGDLEREANIYLHA